MTDDGKLEEHDLVGGALYTYVRGFPVKCIGSTYRLIRRVKDVPSYQLKVLVEAVDGPDKGLWFVCSVANFCSRYDKKEPT